MFRSKQTFCFLNQGHIGMSKRQWREVMRLDKGDLNGAAALRLISTFFGDEYVRNNSQISKGDKYWDIDQKMASLCVHW
jgi:hypothetical protein